MPNILSTVRRRAVADPTAHGAYLILTLDDLRREPGRLVFLGELALMGVVRSYDAAQRLIDRGRLPTPYRIGSRAAWEARDILRMLGATPATPEQEFADNLGDIEAHQQARGGRAPGAEQAPGRRGTRGSRNQKRGSITH